MYGVEGGRVACLDHVDEVIAVDLLVDRVVPVVLQPDFLHRVALDLLHLQQEIPRVYGSGGVGDRLPARTARPLL